MHAVKYCSFLGWIRDVSQSFSFCIHAQSVVIYVVVLTWSLEILLRKIHKASS